MSKHKGKESELIDIGKKLGKSQSKDALVKLLLVRCLFIFGKIIINLNISSKFFLLYRRISMTRMFLHVLDERAYPCKSRF